MRLSKFLLILTMLFSVGSFAQITTPRAASPAAEVSQTIGISKITVNYSRPAVRDRKVWGELVPYGYNRQFFGNGNEAPWRAGANENTTITLSHEATVEGKNVAAGTYGLFYVINEDNSGEVILSKDHRSWGSYWYEQANDALRAKIQTTENAHTERLTFQFINIDNNSAILVLDWADKRFPVKIEFDVNAIVLANAEEELKSTAGFSWQGYNSAAQYALNSNLELEKALVWSTNACNQNPGFTTSILKAQILDALGKTEEAKTTKAEAMKVATEANLNQYGYQLANAGKFDEAIKVMKLNTENHPESANAWDSLGEIHFMAGKKKEAKKYFEKVLSMDAPENVKANSERYLNQMKS